MVRVVDEAYAICRSAGAAKAPAIGSGTWRVRGEIRACAPSARSGRCLFAHPVPLGLMIVPSGHTRLSLGTVTRLTGCTTPGGARQ